MTPIALKLTRFGSFRDTETLFLPTKPGLYYMWGDNQAEPRLEANGAGKSTVWKALTWLFFAKTNNGLKAGDAANWTDGKKSAVELDIADPGGLDPYTIKRTWSPNSWTLTSPHGDVEDLAKDSSNPIAGLLRLDYTAFLQTVVMPQDHDLFLNLKADKQAELFSEVMGLDRWLQRSARASDRARAEDMVLRQAERELSHAQGRLEASRKVDYEDALAGWEGTRRKRLEELTQRHRELVAEVWQLEDDAKDHADAAEDGRRLLAAKKAKLDASWDAFKKVEAELRAGHGRLQGLEAAYNKAVDRALDLKKHEVCPTCGADLEDGAHGHVADSELDRLDKEQRDLVQLRLTLDDVERDVLTVEERARADERAYNVLKDAVTDSEYKHRDLLRRKAQCDKTLDEIEAEHTRVDKEENPYAKLRADADAEQARHRADVKRLQKAVDEAQFRCSIASGWVRWFKDIRLAQIGDALAQLEIEVNNQVTALGLVDWELKFDVDRETNSGSVKRGFSVTVMSPHNSKPVPWEAWSGGERQRLVVAAQMGFANLSRARTGADFSMEVWDEPTKGMSPQGVQDLLEALHTRALREQRVIWVVDHRTLGYSKFAGQVGVIKTAEGSRFDCSGLLV